MFRKLGVVFSLALLTFSCGKIENSNSTDDILYGEFVETDTNPNYLEAKAEIKAKCLQCHSAWKRYTSQRFVDEGLVIPGQPENSKLYARNILATKGSGPKNMPPSGYSPISPAGITAMDAWISSL